MEISKRTVEALQPDPSKDTFWWDDEIPGFGVRVARGGTKSYVIQYRNAEGQTRRLTLGRHGVLTAKEAKDIARQHLAGVAAGKDPAREKSVAREAPTFAEFAKRYLSDYARPRKKPRSVMEDERILETVLLPELGSRKVFAITRKDVEKIHRKMADTPIYANRALALLSKMFNLAEAWEERPPYSNPCRHVDRYPEAARKRYLTGEELARLSAAIKTAETSDDPHKRISSYQALLFRLLLFTGSRLNEILSLKWEHVDFENGLLLLPDSKTGQKTIVLSGPAFQLLNEAPRMAGNPYVIAASRKSPGGAYTHASNPSKSWERVRKQAGLDDVHIHDLRHTFASVGAGRNLGLPMIGALLGHTQAQTTQRYAHLAADPLRQAANLIAGEIAAAMDKKPAAKVVDMNRGR